MAGAMSDMLLKLNESLVLMEETRAADAENMDGFFLIVMGFIIYCKCVLSVSLKL